MSPRSHLPSRASGRKYSATPSTRAGSGPKWAAPPVRARTIGTTVTVGALGIGPLVAGGLAQWVTQPLTVPTRLAASRVLTVGTISLLAGLVLLVVSVRLSLPSLALFLIAGALIGAGSGAVFKGTSGIVLEASPPESRVTMTSDLLIALYVGLSVPVIGAGVALDLGASAPDTVLGFAILVGLGVAVSGWALARHSASAKLSS